MPPLLLDEAVLPGQLAYALHHDWDRAAAADRAALLARIERALAVGRCESTEYVRDVITVWACLVLNTRVRPNPPAPLCTPDTCGRPTLRHAAAAFLSGNMGCAQMSVIRHLLCEKMGPALFTAVGAPDRTGVKKEHAAALKDLMHRFSRECIFSVTGDWMIHAKTAAVCPAWQTCVVDGNQPPFKVAAALHGAELNNILGPVIRMPLHERVEIIGAVEDSVDAFITVATILQELAPNTAAAVNGDVFHHAGTVHPVLFYLMNWRLPGVVAGTCYGIALGSLLLVYNSRGVFHMAADWLYLAMVTGQPGAQDLASFVFGTPSDGNPYLKYRD